MKVESLRIIALGLATAIGYGIVHDQVSVRIAPEFLILAGASKLSVKTPSATRNPEVPQRRRRVM